MSDRKWVFSRRFRVGAAGRATEAVVHEWLHHPPVQ